MSKHIVIDARIRRASTGRPVARLLEHLQTLDTKTRYTVLVEPDDPWQPQQDNFTPLACPYPIFSFNPMQQLSFAQFLRKLKPDLVHFTMSGQQPLLYFGAQITMTHDLTMYRYVRKGRLPLPLHWLRMLGYRLLMWSAHRKARRIIVPTDFIAADVAKFHSFTEGKITRTYEASEPPLKAEAAQPQGVSRPFLLYVGSAFPHKNLEGLAAAFAELAKKHRDLTLVLTGKREQHSLALEKSLEESPVRERILFTGFVSDEELKWLYENAEVYVFPSFSEGFGLPGLEAMVHGCPVASSNATCLPEVYGDAAVYFDPTDPEAMAAQITQVMQDVTLRKQLIENGYKQAKKYSWRHMSEHTHHIYQEVLEQ